MTKTQTLTILGLGGHGWESLKEYVTNCSANIFAYGTTVDWGGSTGYWGRLLELENEKLNQDLHGKKMPILPWGDFNKMVVSLGTLNYSTEVLDLLNFRGLEFQELWLVFEKLAETLVFSLEFKTEFKAYLNKVFAFHEQNKHRIDSVKPICLAYPLNQFVYFKTGKVMGINKFYQKLGVLPKNTFRLFASNYRQVLVGKNSLGVKIVGEDPIDIHELPVDPASLHHRTRSQKPASVSKQFLERLQQSDLIIIPNGSIANWLPLLNINSVKQIILEKSREGKLVWLLNLFRTQNEHTITEYVEYLYKQDIFPHILGPRTLPINLPPETLKQYLAENKIPNLDSLAEVEKLKKLNHNLYLELECHLEHSYKYDPDSVAQSLLRFL